MNIEVPYSYGDATSLKLFQPLPSGEAQYPIEYMEHHRVIKLRETDDEVMIGIARDPDEALLQRLFRFHRKRILYYTVDPVEFSSHLGRTASSIEDLGDSGGVGGNDSVLLDTLANDAPIVNLINSIIMDAIQTGASDIHIERTEGATRVRYRRDGVLSTTASYDADRFQAMSTRIKIMANLNIVERRLPQDGRIAVNIGGETVDLRVSIVPIARGESVVLRIFNRRASQLEIEQLGFDEEITDAIGSLIRHPHGMVLVSGPTGSGKTTTLGAMLRRLNNESVKIVTIEDPIENVIDGIDQIQTHDRIGLTFESLLRRVLRQDPNIIMVGEIRDAPTAGLAVRAALTGHLVLSTVHTNDAASVVSRLLNLEVEPFLLAAVLRGCIAQRLVRSLCPDCRQKRRTNEQEKRLLHHQTVEASQVWEAAGCEACGNTGYRGRFGIAEVLVMDRELERLIAGGGDRDSIEELRRSRGGRTLIEAGLAAAVSGETSIAEVERVVSF